MTSIRRVTLSQSRGCWKDLGRSLAHELPKVGAIGAIRNIAINRGGKTGDQSKDRLLGASLKTQFAELRGELLGSCGEGKLPQ